MVKTRYKIDLPAQMAECEANYHRLLKLMPEHASVNEWQFAISGVNRIQTLEIVILERSRYTTTIQLAQKTPSTTVLPMTAELGESLVIPQAWLYLPKLTVRLYHDARLAEVLAWEDHKRLRARYEYPNRAMYQNDEKAQLNRFLGEWLALSLARGHSTDSSLAKTLR